MTYTTRPVATIGLVIENEHIENEHNSKISALYTFNSKNFKEKHKEDKFLNMDKKFLCFIEKHREEKKYKLTKVVNPSNPIHVSTVDLYYLYPRYCST